MDGLDTPETVMTTRAPAVLKTMSLNGEIYTAGRNFTLPPTAAAETNLNSAFRLPLQVPTGYQIYIKTGQTSNIPVI